MITQCISQRRTKIFHFIWRRSAKCLWNLNCEKKSMLLVLSYLLGTTIKSVSLIFWLRVKPRLTPGMNLTLCSAQPGEMGAEGYSLLWRLTQNLQRKQENLHFPPASSASNDFSSWYCITLLKLNSTGAGGPVMLFHLPSLLANLSS